MLLCSGKKEKLLLALLPLREPCHHVLCHHTAAAIISGLKHIEGGRLALIIPEKTREKSLMKGKPAFINVLQQPADTESSLPTIVKQERSFEVKVSCGVDGRYF